MTVILSTNMLVNFCGGEKRQELPDNRCHASEKGSKRISQENTTWLMHFPFKSRYLGDLAAPRLF